MREECNGAFVLHGDYVKLKSRHDELLEALQECVALINGQGRGCELQNAQEAIAKATGETK